MVIFYLAPLNKFGNIAFRELCLQNGADFVFTEMIDLDKIIKGNEAQIKKAKINENLNNLGNKTIYQIICQDIFNMEKGINKILQINPNILELNYNMGCPQSTLCDNECGGGILKNKNKIKEVSSVFFNICNKLHIKPSVKTRLGLTRDNINIYENLKLFQEIGINKIYIHARTLSESYLKNVTYSEIKKAKEMFSNMEIIFNGNVCDSKTFQNALNTNCDGIMVGREALQNPEIFFHLKQYLKNNIDYSKKKSGLNLKEKKKILSSFLKIIKKANLNTDVNISQLKSNISYITKDCIFGSEFREKINNSNRINEFENIVNNMK